MLTSVLIALGLCAAAILLTWIGYELNFSSPPNDSTKKRIRIWLGAIALAFIGLTTWATIRSEQFSNRNQQELKDLPRQVGEYIRNTTPPPGFVPPRPNPVTGVIAAADGDWGATAVNMARQIYQFLDSEGAIPTRKPNETEVDFIVRSNAWYSTVMNQYKKQFNDQAVTMAGLLVEKGLLDKQVNDLARNPVNITGIKMLAQQIEAGGIRFRDKYKRSG